MKSIARVVSVLLAIAGGSAMAQSVADFRKQHHPRAVAYDHGDPKINDFARLVAEAMKVPYLVEQTPNGPKVWLAPKDEAQDSEIQHRISQFAFVVKACGKPELVTPDTPAGSITSCTK